MSTWLDTAGSNVLDCNNERDSYNGNTMASKPINRSSILLSRASNKITECRVEVTHLLWEQGHAGSNPVIPTLRGFWTMYFRTGR